MGAEATLQDSVTAGAGAVTSEASARRRRPRRPRDATRIVRADVPDGRDPGRVPVAGPALGHGVAQDARPARPRRTRRSCPSLPQTFEFQGKTYDVYVVPIDGVDRSLALFKPGRAAEPVRRPREPGRRADHVAGVVADARTRVDARAARGATSPTSGTLLDFPRLLFNTIAIAVIGMIGTVRLVHARRVRLRPLPVPGPDPPVHAADRDDLPAVGGDPDPDLHDLRRSSAGWGRGCRSSCRRSSPTPSTCSCVRQYFLTIPREMDEAAVDRRRRPVPDAGLGDPAAGVAGRSSRSRSSTSSTRGTTSSSR